MKRDNDRISEYVREYRTWLWVQRAIIVALTVVIVLLVLHESGVFDDDSGSVDNSVNLQGSPIVRIVQELPDEEPVDALTETEDYAEPYYGRLEISEEETERQYEWLREHTGLFPIGKVAFAEGNSGLIRFLYLYGNGDYTVPESVELTKDELSTDIPLLLQWDDRWGYDTYGDYVIGIDGCGPTALSMVVVGLTGDETATPRTIAEYAMAQGLYLYGTGTKWALFTRYSAAHDLRCDDLGNDTSAILAALSDGKPVICSVKKGTFTLGGHFIVLTAIDEDGSISINDPNNPDNSERKWQLSEFKSEISNAWAFGVR